MATYILIHGAAQGGWCWHKVKRILEKQGHAVIAPDLPGHAIPNDLPTTKVTFERYVSSVRSLIEGCDGTVILVGHSMGGAIITAAAESMYEKIDKLVYVCALIPKNGDTIVVMLDRDMGSDLKGSFSRNDLNMTVSLIPEKAGTVVYNGCDAADIEFAQQHVVPQPVLPFTAPIDIPLEHFKKIGRLGIVCTEDRSLTPAFQEKMYHDAGCAVIRLQSGHAPFFSKPQELGDLLQQP